MTVTPELLAAEQNLKSATTSIYDEGMKAGFKLGYEKAIADINVKMKDKVIEQEANKEG